jgi:hypothetical protein
MLLRILNGDMYGRRKLGRSRRRWVQNADDDSRKMGIISWRVKIEMNGS